MCLFPGQPEFSLIRISDGGGGGGGSERALFFDSEEGRRKGNKRSKKVSERRLLFSENTNPRGKRYEWNWTKEENVKEVRGKWNNNVEIEIQRLCDNQTVGKLTLHYLSGTPRHLADLRHGLFQWTRILSNDRRSKSPASPPLCLQVGAISWVMGDKWASWKKW